jgi:hypothetical protein
MDEPTTRVLSPALLSDLEARWHAQGAPIVKLLRPGLSDEEMDEATRPLGVKLPAEARRWWGWHDGAAADRAGAGCAELGPGRPFLPLSVAVRVSMEIQDVLRQIWDGTLGPDWRPGYISMDGTELPPVMNAGVGNDEPVPVRAFVFDGPDAATPGTRSIGELVDLWIRAIDAGAWLYNRDRKNWDYHLERVEKFELFDLL